MADKYQIEANELLVRAGDSNTDLFYLESGKLLVFTIEGTKVTPLSYIHAGEYLGELSFFDRRPRSAHVVSVETCTVIRYPSGNTLQEIPDWLLRTLTSLSGKLREVDEYIGSTGIKRTNVDTLKPLTVDEQRRILTLLD